MIGFKEIIEVSGGCFANSPLGKMSQETSFDKPSLEYDKPIVVAVRDVQGEKVDDHGKTYTDETGKLRPDTEYTLGGNVYKTDDQGRITTCEGTPKNTPENTRDVDAQTRVGGDDRKAGDQGGHIIGRDMGGDGGVGNLIPMDATINQSDYKRMENDVKKAEEAGNDVATKTEMEYQGDSDRPSKITTTVTIDGKDTVYTFDNDLEGSLMDQIKENSSESDIKAVQADIDEKGGKISSIKEEYAADGTLEKTTATITYTDDGKNYRGQHDITHTGGASA